MLSLINKYLDKLVHQGLSDRETPVFIALDARPVSNKPLEGEVLALSGIFDLMNINTILLSKPSEPYRSIIRELIRMEPASPGEGRIVPTDCETRTFFHDIPVIQEPSVLAIAHALSRRKSAVTPGGAIASYGVVTPEQAFVSFSSACFSLFVKYFHDSLLYLEECARSRRAPDGEFVHGFLEIAGRLQPDSSPPPPLMPGPPEGPDDVLRMIAQAGEALVARRLVDSYFGNISFVHGGAIYISQTSSSLDELEGLIDEVPLDGSSTTGITASSELSAHKGIYIGTQNNAILHGHPKFSVIMSMRCLKENCEGKKTSCQTDCRETRYVAGDTPVVSGEIGRGPTGLVHTVPQAMKDSRSGGVVVCGHGVFTSGKGDFNSPFGSLLEIEKRCRDEYFGLIGKYLPI